MQILENISLKQYNTFGINVNARCFSSFTSYDELYELLFYTASRNQVPFILGGGSNILFTKNIEQPVFKNNIRGIEIAGETADEVLVRAGAGENWHKLVMFCINSNLYGIENLALIPGNTGASPMQNIGAYGVEIKDVFHELEAVHITEKKPVIFNITDCGFGYRESVFKRKYKNQFVITHVTYKLKKQPHFNTSYGAIEQELQNMGVQQLNIKAIAQAVINIRTSKLPDPKTIGNAGSFFKNPEVPVEVFEKLKISYPLIVGYPVGETHTKLAAGWLIEQCGWKGYRKDDAGCHAKQALVLVNYGNANGKEIYHLSTQIIESVQQKFGVQLEREVNIM
jgi:UDP-N-acetylmuramate dehydrogenase